MKSGNTYLTTSQVGKLFGVSKVTILRWIDKGYIKSFRLPSGANRIYVEDIRAFADMNGLPTTGY